MRKIISTFTMLFLFSAFVFSASSRVIEGKVVSVEGNGRLIHISTTRTGPISEDQTFSEGSEFLTLPDTTATLQVDHLLIMLNESTNVAFEESRYDDSKLLRIWRVKSGEVAIKFTTADENSYVVVRSNGDDVLLKKATIYINEKGTVWVFYGEVFFFRKGYFSNNVTYDPSVAMSILKEGYVGTSIKNVGGDVKFNVKKLKLNEQILKFLQAKDPINSTPTIPDDNKKSSGSSNRRLDALPPKHDERSYGGGPGREPVGSNGPKNGPAGGPNNGPSGGRGGSGGPGGGGPGRR